MSIGMKQIFINFICLALQSSCTFWIVNWVTDGTDIERNE